jgi:hypothetical protein
MLKQRNLATVMAFHIKYKSKTPGSQKSSHFLFFCFSHHLQNVHITDNPLLLLYQMGSPTGMKAQFYVHENLKDTTYEVVNETDLWTQFIHVRLQTRLPLTGELQTDAISEAFLLLQKKVGICILCLGNCHCYSLRIWNI